MEKWRKSDGIGASLVSVFAMRVLDFCFLCENECEENEYLKVRKFLGGLFVRHILSFSSNCQKSADYFPGVECCRFVFTADVFHPTLTLFHFSCDANVFFHHFGNVVVVRAKRPIQKGEIVSQNLCSFWKMKREERKCFYERFADFECSCRACRNDWPLQDVLRKTGFVFYVCSDFC